MRDFVGYVVNIFLSLFDQRCFFSHLYFKWLYFQVTFEGIRGPGWQGDIAIDEVSIKSCGGGGGGGGAGGSGGEGGCGECLFAVTSPIVM